MTQKTKAWIQFEEKLETFIRKASFSDVAHNPEGFNSRDSRCQIDVIGGNGSNVLLIECRTQDNPGPSAELKKWVQQLNGRREEYLQKIKSHPKYQKYKNIFLILAVSKEIEVSDSQKSYAESLGVSIWDDRYVSYYEKQPGALKDVTLHNILADIGAKIPEDAVQSVIAFKTKITIGEKSFNAYSFSVNPKEIIKYCYVARREHGNSDYYQRIIDPGRLGSVADYINAGGSFVNNIIVAHDPILTGQRLNFSPVHKYLSKIANDDLINRLENSKYNLEIGLLQFPLTYKCFWVIDGQHRLFGYLAANSTKQEGATVPVVMIEQIPARDQMRLFVDINHKQKTINANLIWDIKGI